MMSLTDFAADRLRALYARGEHGKVLAHRGEDQGLLRPRLRPLLAEEAAPTDETVTDKGETVLIDRKATLFLIGTVMDYEVKAMTQGFNFTNPNEKGRCGCGESSTLMPTARAGDSCRCREGGRRTPASEGMKKR